MLNVNTAKCGRAYKDLLKRATKVSTHEHSMNLVKGASQGFYANVYCIYLISSCSYTINFSFFHVQLLIEGSFHQFQMLSTTTVIQKSGLRGL